MTPREAVDHLAAFINQPSEGDDREADAIEAVGVLEKLLNLSHLCENLIHTADNTGCTPDLTVVSKESLGQIEDFIVNRCGVEELPQGVHEAVNVLDKLVVDAEECSTPVSDLSDRDYVLTDGAAWFTVGKFSVRIHQTDEGVAVDIYALGREMDGTLGAAWALTSESEEVIESAKLDQENE
jgi:hypothetical protein